MPFMHAILFGLTIALAVGPIALLIINHGIVHGPRVALGSAAGAALADFTLAVVAFFFGAILVHFLHEFQLYFHLVSSLILLFFGLYMVHGAIKQNPEKVHAAKVKTAGLKAVYLLTLVNPLTIIIYAAFIGQIKGIISPLQSFVLAFGVLIGSLIIQISLAFFGSTLRRFIKNNNHLTYINILSGFGIFLFGVYGLYKLF